jgi:hypothetical protein
LSLLCRKGAICNRTDSRVGGEHGNHTSLLRMAYLGIQRLSSDG